MDDRNLTAPASILVVDDDPIVRSLMSATLTRDGFVVIEAEDGVEGCRLYDEHHPDLLLVDVVKRSEEHTSELQSHLNLVCRLLLEKKKSMRICNDCTV